MKTILLLLACLLTAAGVCAAPTPPKIRVLLVAGNEPGESHDYVNNPDILIRVLDATGYFQVTRLTADAQRPVPDFLDGLAMLTRRNFDVVVLYAYKYADHNGYAGRIMDFVAAGGGLVALHGSSGTFTNNPQWLQLLGAKFTGHTRGRFIVDLAVEGHPVLAGLPRSFEIEDEDYFHRLVPGAERQVLGVIRQRPQGDRPGASNDVIWTTQHGPGRVFYTALGHGKAAWQNPVWQRLVAQAICWAAGQPREVVRRE